MWSQLRRDPSAVLCRKKPLDSGTESSPLLKRCLSLLDLLLLEIGCMIGAGVFIVVGSSIRDKAGAGVLLSYLIAGLPSFIAALCYAEFGARVPKAGSTYDFVYVALGEFWAAMVGWFYVSSGIFWIAADGLSWSSYFDSLVGHVIKNKTMQAVAWFDSPYLTEYPDFFACGVILLFSGAVATGAKNSALINNVFSVIKLAVIVFIVVYGLTLADLRNWTDSSRGGFLPYGLGGVVAAAPDSFLSFVGFEAATMAGEEAKDPRKSIVLSIGAAFIVVVVAYVLMCSSLTLMLPYDRISPISSFADAFEQLGAPWAKYVVAIGALSALTTILFGTVFSLPRYIYAVSSDGLIFGWLGKVHAGTGVPLLAISIFTVLSMLIALLFDLKSLIEFLSMGSLLCYTLVPASVIVMRYRPSGENSGAGCLKQKYAMTRTLQWTKQFKPGQAVSRLVGLQGALMVACCGLIALVDWTDLVQFIVSVVLLVGLTAALMTVQLWTMAFQQNQDQLWFKVPLVPVLPSISMFFNILMIAYLKPMTWLRFAIYMLMGVLVYFLYGIRHSAHKVAPDNKEVRVSRL